MIVLYFLVVLFFVVVFCYFFFLIFILNFNRNRQNKIKMKFQDASCPPLAVYVLSSSVEPPSESLAVSSSLDATVITRRSTWSSTAMSVA